MPTIIAFDAQLFEAVLERIAAQVPEVRYIAQDLGQLENYEMRPPVSWPCALLDVDEVDYSDLQNDRQQLAEGIVQVRIGLVKYTDSNNLTPGNIRPNAYRYMEVADKVAKALHGWAPAGCTRLLRRKAATEKRDDDIRVKVLRFAFSYTETMQPVKATVPRPAPVIGNDIPN